LSGNSSDQGGGALDGTFNNCIFSGNSANSDGGGAYWGTLENCILWGNSAYQGGGAAAATLNNCTLGGNLATGAYASGGGAKDAMLNNCIVYFNSAPNYPNYYSSTFNYSCTTPLPSGPGNIEANPAFVDTNGWSNLHLQSNSLCIDAGNNAYAPGSTDLDGNPRIVGGMVDMGAYEFQSSTGTRYVNLSNPTPTPPYTTWATAAINIQDAVDAAVAGDQIMVTNGLYAAGGRAVYGSMTNRVAIDKAVAVRSVDGPLVTLIQGQAAPGTTNGDGAIRCVYLGTNAVLSGFTLTNGHTRTAGDYYKEHGGGGAWCESSGMLINCTLSGNSADYHGGGAYSGRLITCTLSGNSADRGGGTSVAALSNCILTGNSAVQGGGALDGAFTNCIFSGNSATDGGGASWGTLNNCTLSGNSATGSGGGAYNAALNNCIVYYNSARNGPNSYGSTFNYSCTTPLPSGTGNIATAPAYADTNGWSNLRLQSISPCINAGNNAYAPGSTDLDGRPRIVSGTVDMGAYEFQGTGSVISYAWLQQYGLPTDGSADYADPDHDGLNNWQEWIAGTTPTNAASALRILSLSNGVSGTAARWSSVTNRTYSLERAANLGNVPAFGLVRSNLAGLDGSTTFTDTNATGPGPFFYRVRVEY
jgi:hypothetical protein